MTPVGQLVISPHPDDAVWSVGGRLARWAAARVPAMVITVFDGPGDRLSDPAGSWRHIAEPALRRAEDTAALRDVGVRHVSLGFPDAALRTSSTGYRYVQARDLFGPPCPDDSRLRTQVSDALRRWCRTAWTVHAPLAAGRHADHVLVRAAVAALAPAHVLWYEDFPYRLRADDTTGLRSRVEPLHAADLDRWLASAARYASQGRALFGDITRLRDALTRRARRHAAGTGLRYADRYWVPAQLAREEIPCPH
jgi:LmbE family N-acetylglucosaminyl deacetylase